MSQISFYELNLASEKKGAVITASSNQVIAENMVDEDLETFWLSEDADDTITETLTFDFLEPVEVSMLILRKHNLKEFQIKYWNGGSYVDFSTPISETVNSETEINFYNNFTPVFTDSIQITALKTITVDAQKQIAEFIVTNFIGQFEQYPVIDARLNKKIARVENFRGKESVFEKGKYFECTLKFDNYPNENDVLFAETLRNYAEEFYIWISNGDPTNFIYQVEPFRKQDIYLVNEVSNFRPELNKGVYTLPYSFELSFAQA